jgi:hypothetical protein
MNTHKLISLALVVSAGALTYRNPPPPFGPGAVIIAVKDVLAAQAAGDRAAIARALDTKGDHLFGFDVDAQGKVEEVTEDTPMAFFDVTSSGEPRAATGCASPGPRRRGS